MTPQELLATISAGKFSPAYYFYGTEDYRMIEAEKFLAKQFLPAALYATNYRRLDGKKTRCADLLAELAVYPMLGERQIFAISDFQHYKPEDVTKVLKLVHPGDTSRILLLSSPSDKKPKRDSAFFKNVSKVAIDVEFKKLTAHETAGQIQRNLAKHNIKIDKDALQLMTDLVSGNRGAVETETDKLIDLKGEGATVTVEDVRSSCAGYWVYNVFELGDRVVSGDTVNAMRQIRMLIAEGNTPTTVLFFLGQHYLSVYRVKSGKPLEVWRRYHTDRLRKQAEKYSFERLEQIIIAIAETDAELRRSPLIPEVLLDSLVLQLTTEQKGSRG